MIENGTLKIGGNTIKVWIGKQFNKLGKFLTEKGLNIISRHKTIFVTNPSAKLFNPFTLCITFTVDSIDKYQIVLQSDYIQKYKECEDGMINLTDNEMLMAIHHNRHAWFKKTI